MIERLKEITELKLNQGEVGLPVLQTIYNYIHLDIST